MQNTKDSMFALVEASQLSLDDKFMQHKPTTDNQCKFKKLLTGAIHIGLSDFWHPKLDPSFNEAGTGLVFEAGKMPALGKSYDWWEIKANEYLPERGSRLGTRTEYVAFLGVFIKKLVASGWSVPKAWNAVCDDSRELGHYWASESSRHDFEVTGSRKFCGFCDLANTYKILAEDEEAIGFWVAGGSFHYFGGYDPLANLGFYNCRDCDRYLCVGWLVLSK